MTCYKNKILFILCAVLVFSLGEAIAANKSEPEDISANFVKSYLAGDYAIRHKEHEEASRIFLEAIGKSPDNPTLLGYSYNLMLTVGNIDKAVGFAELYLKKSPNNSSINILRATQAVRDKDYNKASEILNISTKNEAITVSSSTNRVILPFLQMWVKIGQGKKDEASKLIANKVTDASAPSVFSHYQKALINDILGDVQSAARSFAKVSSKDEILPYHFIKSAGNFYERTGNKDKALELYNSYQEQLPNLGYFQKNLENIKNNQPLPQPLIKDASYGFAEVLEEAARVLFSSGYSDEGIAYLRLSMALKTENDENKVLLSNYYEENKQFTAAAEVYSQIPEGSDFYITAKIALAENLYNAGEKKDAIRQLKKLTKKDNPSMVAMLTLADLYRKDEKFKPAAQVYTKIIDLLQEPSKENWPIFFARGICYERSGQWELAENDLLKALELKPEQPEVLNYLGYSWIDRNENIEKAFAMIEKAVVARPDDPQIIDSMGWALYKMNDFEGASNYLERAVELTPYDPTINDHLGDVYWRQGRFNEARFQWNRVLKYNENKDVSEEEVQKKLLLGSPEENNNS
jgi:tetratricopeptide (TPR) repeat protein